MKKLISILIITLICFSNIGIASNENIEYSVIFSPGSEGDIPNPTNTRYSTMVKVSEEGKVLDKKIYEDLIISYKGNYKKDFPKYEIIRFDYEKSKIKKRTKLSNGAKKGDILYLVDFSI